MNMQNDILAENISELFGFGEMTDAEKSDLLESVGASILESAVLRFVVDATDAEAKAFEAHIDAHTDDEDMLVDLIEKFPAFGLLLEEETAAFKREAKKVLGM